MEKVRFEAPDGIGLEGELRRPDGAARATAVMCHPHPEHGGSKDHPLLWAIRNELAARGFVVLTFNFRGVMGSEGSHTGGVRELDDARAAVARVREEAGGPTFVAGWSFGANVALRLAVDDERVGAVAVVGIPLGEAGPRVPELPDRARLVAFDRPVLIVVGEADQYSPVPDVRSLARRIPSSEVAVFPGADHFFWKRERDVARRIGDFAAAALLGEASARGDSKA